MPIPPLPHGGDHRPQVTALVREALTAWLVIAAAGTALLMASPPDDSYTWVWPGMVLFGLGAGFVLAPATAASISRVPHEVAGMAGASVNMFRQLGNVLGAGVLGTILTAHFSAMLPERLAGAGVPSGVAAQVESAAAHGGHAPAGAGAIAATIARGVAGAFTDSLRPGWLIVTVCALVLAAVLTFVLVAEKTAAHRK
ncbi:MFS transporter [Microbispora hainanensis]|uniref:MFS transporter n=1 Tax=Microbispora hainanensis TaxID=568844 RepID=UPI00142ECDF4|nr:MFS transporter [Microbispora hainanensis]